MNQGFKTISEILKVYVNYLSYHKVCNSKTRMKLNMRHNPLIILFVITACTLVEAPPSVEPSIIRLASPTPPTPLPQGWTDEIDVMSGICFEAAYDAANKTFALHSAEDHIKFYDLADFSRLCRQPVTRHPFDFTTGRALVGLWSVGIGCKAHHEVLDVDRNDADKAITARLRFIIEGDCPYELVRPFWVGIPNAQGYTITFEVIMP